MAQALTPGDMVFLIGEMGAGKSALARAIIQARLAALGRMEETPSPTYTLTQTYALEHGAMLIHADLYRLSNAEEVEELGLFDDTAVAIILLEWPDRLGDAVPSRRLEINLTIPPTGEGRRIRIMAFGPGWECMAAAIEAAAPQN